MNKIFKLIILPISSILSNRSLILQFSKRELAAEHKRSLLGGLWLVTQPLLLMSVYTFVFSQVYSGSYGIIADETNIHYAIGIFIGITLLHMFTDTLANAALSITSNPNFVKKVVFPLEVLPLSIVTKNVYKFTISFILILLAIFSLLKSLPPTVVWLPFIFISSLLLASGTAWLLSAIGVFFRDISPIIQIISLCMLWLSGIFYSARDLPPAAWQILKYNPVLLNIEMARDVILWGVSPNLQWLTYSLLFSLCIFYLGFFVFHKLKPTFADIL